MGNNSEILVDGMGEILSAKKAKAAARAKMTPEEKAAKTAEKRANGDAAWNLEAQAKFPWYKAGSLRDSTDGDWAVLPSVHGKVAKIVCQGCNAERLVNKQDVFQVRLCSPCKAGEDKAKAKAKREAKKEMNGTSGQA